jgi:hypothetical protein
MRSLAYLAAVAGLLFAVTAAIAGADLRDEALDVHVDSGAAPLAAWQVELTEGNGRMTVVGVENGADAAFAEPPYYDRAAVQAGEADRVIVAAYSLSPEEELPRGRTRVATVHVRIAGDGEPSYNLRLIAAGDANGRPIAATATLSRR